MHVEHIAKLMKEWRSLGICIILWRLERFAAICKCRHPVEWACLLLTSFAIGRNSHKYWRLTKSQLLATREGLSRHIEASNNGLPFNIRSTNSIKNRQHNSSIILFEEVAVRCVKWTAVSLYLEEEDILTPLHQWLKKNCHLSFTLQKNE